MACPDGNECDWLRTGQVPVPGTSMSKLTDVERYYSATYDKWVTLRPLIDQVGGRQGLYFHPFREISEIGCQIWIEKVRCNSWLFGDHHGQSNGRRDTGFVLYTYNARVAVKGFLEFGKRTLRRLAHRAEGSEEKRITYVEIQVRLVPGGYQSRVIWPVSTGGRLYYPFMITI